ncbi:HNH endonuclease [Niveibacterium sp. 24ML]|uniref:HNH endonuclease signature motif containing protein n=1 Tax=Niveibacterium sp. 24ML TaxID=2985512 RepID=UPI00226D756B|nr:HNH endonuclease signature motif containing protein [Niveibacterium sp. 24ML]MCX9157279.1 HNH endonuclease [Niveibacterium sp. 24ML]
MIICDCDTHDDDDDQAKPSRAKRHTVDPVPWAIIYYGMMTGECCITHCVAPGRFADQFALIEPDATDPERPTRETSTYLRRREVCMRVLKRAGGVCEYCGERGFEPHDSRTYLETHHVVPLCEGVPDQDSNVAALCPDGHRRAHHGQERSVIRAQLQAQFGR